MKYYSEKLNKYYAEDQLELLKQDEEKYDEKLTEQEVIKAERANRAKEIEEAFKAVEVAQKKADDLLEKFCKDYGSYHMTLKEVNPKTYHSLFDLLFGVPFPFRTLI